jgi:peptidylprolyl isomerase
MRRSMRRPRLHLIVTPLVALALFAAGCGDDNDDEPSAQETATTQTDSPVVEEQAPPETSGALSKKPKLTQKSGDEPSELQKKDLIVGKGRAAGEGDLLTVNYVGATFKGNKEFDTSFGKQPFQLQLGAGMVIPGWDQGLAGMRVGGRRELVIPADLAYGPAGSPPDIGPNETLVFVVDLLGVN